MVKRKDKVAASAHESVHEHRKFKIPDNPEQRTVPRSPQPHAIALHSTANKTQEDGLGLDDGDRLAGLA